MKEGEETVKRREDNREGSGELGKERVMKETEESRRDFKGNRQLGENEMRREKKQ